MWGSLVDSKTEEQMENTKKELIAHRLLLEKIVEIL
eukprot:gene14630-4327_t